MFRNRCIVCNEKNPLCPVYKQAQFPVCISSSSEPSKSDLFLDLEYGGCTSCGCVQLQTLIDPSILYSVTHNNTYDTPTWNQHHKLFSEFILHNTEKTEFLEIGGASRYLIHLLSAKRKLQNVTIIDLADNSWSEDDLHYIQANCEDYDFSLIDPSVPIILSHVFEHLYNPLKFLEQLTKAQTQTLFISIPNMEICLQKKYLSFLHVEHTYYCTVNHIQRMMFDAGLSCKEIYYFKEHSIFFHFQRETTLRNKPEYPIATKLLSEFHTYYLERDKLYEMIVLKKKTYIVPGGHYGQLIYHYLRDQKHNIIGFLDNDSSKVGKRVYGTDKYVFPMSEIKNKREEEISVLLNAGPYLEEIKEQILSYNPSVEFICV